ncbi:MAG: dephospho-CoA kinase [Moheibacter sp.]
MKIVGLTGGIGSGKSTLAKWFRKKGIPVYNADDEAKLLMNNDPELIKKLTLEFGEETYKDGIYNRDYISTLVFNNKKALKKLNSIVHPAVFRHFESWLNSLDSAFAVKEAAILFESGSWKDCDSIVSVAADEDIRIKRVMERDRLSAEQIQGRIKNQWTDSQRIEKSDFVIYNNHGLDELKLEFDRVYKDLLKQYQSG